MPLIADVDLLLIEPSLFIDGAAASTNLLTVTDGEVSGTALSSASADFVAANVDVGHVAVINGEALEILDRVSGTQLHVSRPRVQSTDDPIPPPDSTGQTLAINTFARLIDQTQRDLFQILALREDDPDLPLDEDEIVNVGPVGRLIALRTIERGYALASAADVDDGALAARARHYTDLADKFAMSLTVLLDLDGDGRADATRGACVTVLLRE
jgi:hypothetical protein